MSVTAVVSEVAEAVAAETAMACVIFFPFFLGQGWGSEGGSRR